MITFRTEKVTDRITRIYGVCTELMYLVEGEEKAALLDTGSGFGSLKKVVEELTDKPVIVLLTHGHTDHAMGAAEFSEVYMNHEDDYIYIPHGKKEFRLEGLEMSEAKKKFDMEADYIPTADVETFHDMKGGDRFDLGGLHIRVFDIPGHTRGSEAFLIEEERVLLTGDACNNFTFLFEDYSLSIKEYRDNLIRFREQVNGLFDMVLSSHGDGRLPVDIIEEVTDVCTDILRGNTDEIPFQFRGTDGLIAKATAGMGRPRLDGKYGNIVYSNNRII